MNQDQENSLKYLDHEVRRLANEPLTGMSDIVRIIRNAEHATGLILRIANSAFYGMPRRVESLNMAMVVLGMYDVSFLLTCIRYTANPATREKTLMALKAIRWLDYVYMKHREDIPWHRRAGQTHLLTFVDPDESTPQMYVENERLTFQAAVEAIQTDNLSEDMAAFLNDLAPALTEFSAQVRLTYPD